MSLTPEEIEKNWLRYRSLCEKLGDRSEAVIKMLDVLEEQLALCPASSKKDFHNAFPGGLVEHSLRVLANSMKLIQAFGWKVPKDSLIIACLFHDIGKVGFPMDSGELKDAYLPQTEQWRIDKNGEEYMYNRDMPYMPTAQRSVYLLQKYGINLKKDEYLSILLNDGFVIDENKGYCLKIDPLVYCVQTADYISTMQEKGGNCAEIWNK